LTFFLCFILTLFTVLKLIVTIVVKHPIYPID